ncbi:MAG: hypothetical protein LBL62_12280, partial [Planctomycetaceae bacterium]|nr:hypothetical protein [Planctomycetaceae bacterium]
MRTLTFTIIFLSIAVFTQAGMLTLSEKLLAEEKQNVNNNPPDIFDKQYIKNIMDKVNQYQLTHPHQKFDDNWIRGTYYTGVMAC